MNLFRTIPAIVIEEQKCIKTKKYKNYKYLGDPINICSIFNSKKIDEILIVDKSSSLNIGYLSRVLNQLFVPVTFGGRLSSLDTVDSLFDIGVDKVSISTHSFDYNLIEKIVNKFGAQAVSISLDFKRESSSVYNLYGMSGHLRLSSDLVSHLQILSSIGVGDIAFKNINHDGMRCGIDMSILNFIPDNFNMPILLGCGASSYDDIEILRCEKRISGVIISDLFTLYGRYDSVLINYRNQNDL